MHGAEDGVFGVGFGGRDKFFKGTGFKPGVLIEEINVVVALSDGVFQALVVGDGESKVIGTSNQFSLGEIRLNEIGRSVRGIIVPDVNVYRYARRRYRLQTPGKPLHSVI